MLKSNIVNSIATSLVRKIHVSGHIQMKAVSILNENGSDVKHSFKVSAGKCFGLFYILVLCCILIPLDV